jgi:serine/threonine protein kinase
MGHPDLLDANELHFGAVLGSGGFGAVYRGTYRGEQVAIKKLHPMDGKISPLQLEEFKKEVGNLQALRHQRLVSFVGAAWHASSNSLCLVLEYMPNGSLYDLLHQRRQPLTKSQRWNMAMQIADGVDFLHGRNPPFVHRDLKSLNVVLDLDFNAKLCDFGLTQSMEKTHITRKENEGGSPRYMAPELFDSKGRITEKVDIWALGCLVVEVFANRVPHEECNAIPQVMTKILVDRKLPFLDWTGVHPEIRSLAESAFIFDTRERTDANRFVEGLRRLQSFFT